MEFEIATAESLSVTDSELLELLTQVYVVAGFTSEQDAESLFEPSAVKARGTLIAAREVCRSNLAGMIIVVPPDSSARCYANDDEVELHLLGVKLEYRRHGLGHRLVHEAVALADAGGYSKVILWTQFSMAAAQSLYESVGFVHVGDLVRSGRDFKVYEKHLRT